MIIKNIKICITVLLIILFPVYAFTQVDVIPKVSRNILGKNNSLRNYFIVSNPSPEKKVIKTEVEYYNDPRGTQSWLTVSYPEIKLQAREKKKIFYQINVQEPLEKEIMAMVYFFEKNQNTRGISIQQRLGCAVYADRKGSRDQKISIMKKSLSKTGQKISCDLCLTNSGNSFIFPQVFIALDKGQERLSYECLAADLFLGPNEKKDLNYVFSEEFSPGIYQVHIFLTCPETVSGQKLFGNSISFLMNEKGEIINE